MKNIIFIILLISWCKVHCQTNQIDKEKLVLQLDSIDFNDQKYRSQLKEVERKFGTNSQDVNNLWRKIKYNDSINIKKVVHILDNYGWLGEDEVGEKGALTLFLVVQHSNQKTQEKYLPMMAEAVKNGKAKASRLALLEDRVALGQGKKQIYGSQVRKNNTTLKYYVRPLEDPINVNVKRAEVGLSPIEEYVKKWDIKWNPHSYLLELQNIEAYERKED